MLDKLLFLFKVDGVPEPLELLELLKTRFFLTTLGTLRLLLLFPFILLNEREMVHYPVADGEQGSTPQSISDGQAKFEILENRENREIIHGVDCRTI